MLAAVLLCAGGGATPPRGDRLAALRARLADGEDFTAVLCGARVEAAGAHVQAMREPGEWKRRPPAALAVTPGRPAVWDGRFEIVTDQSGLRVEAAAGRLAQLSDVERAVLALLPPAARAAAPVLIDPEGRPVVMLALSNVFMTFAWYGHLKFGAKPLWIVVLISWGIAFFEYWLAVPANRIGHQVYSAAELKTMQEVITLLVFAIFSVMYLGEKLTVNHLIGFALIAGGAFFIFKGPL